MPEWRQIANPGIVPGAIGVHGRCMAPRPPSDDPTPAQFAWARFRKLMLWMGLVTLAAVAVALTLLYRDLGFVSIHFFVATALGVGFAMMLVAGLMGLVFVSHGTGHDEVVRRSDEDAPRD